MDEFVNNVESERRRHSPLMDNVGHNGHTRSTDNKRNLNGSRTEKSRCNRRPRSAFTEGVNRAQFSKSSLYARHIKQPTVALLGLLSKAVSTSLCQHQQHGVVSPNPDPTVGR